MSVLKERMRKVNLYPLQCRLWIDDNEGQPDATFDWVVENVMEWLERCKTDRGIDVPKLAEAIINIHPVNAVELLDMDGHGVVYYKDWP